MYHAIKISRRLSKIELYVDGIPVKLSGGNGMLRIDIKNQFARDLFRKPKAITTTIISSSKTFTYGKF
jgi:hypothetical protein